VFRERLILKMSETIGVLALLLIVGSVLIRIRILRAQGANAMKFGQRDRRDYFIPPFALIYFYTIFGNLFGWPLLSCQMLFNSEYLSAFGAVLCVLGVSFFYWSILSFGKSFRVGIDIDKPDALITSGAFSVSRNPIYVAFLFVLAGEFFIFPNWIPLVYLFAACWLINRQIGLEENFLRQHYESEFKDYCQRVRRYL
jgi:protein-S-isoprenylcysteine O-methyltransferase Ste14